VTDRSGIITASIFNRGALMSEEPIDISVIAAKFPNEKAALDAFEDLDRWIHRGKREASAYRLGDGDSRRTVAAVVETVSGHAEPIARRLQRRGGTLCELPEPDTNALVERTMNAAEQGLQARRSYEVALPLSGATSDPDMN
jgi:hypothetical protein